MRYYSTTAFVAMMSLAMTWSASANASIYRYTGGAFDSFISSDGSYQPYTASNHVTFEFTTNDPLAANTVIGSFATPFHAINAPVPQVTSWSFSDGFNTVTNAEETAFQFFNIATDANGQINKWNIALMPVSAANGYLMGSLVSKNVGSSGCVPGVGTCLGVQSYAYTGQTPYAFGGSSQEGSWNSAVSSVPLPNAAWLFLTGIISVLAKKRRAA